MNVTLSSHKSTPGTLGHESSKSLSGLILAAVLTPLAMMGTVATTLAWGGGGDAPARAPGKGASRRRPTSAADTALYSTTVHSTVPLLCV